MTGKRRLLARYRPAEKPVVRKPVPDVCTTRDGQAVHRVPDETIDQWIAQAKAEGMTPTEWIKRRFGIS